MLEGQLTAKEALALVTGSFDDFSRHGAKVYNLSEDVARQTGRVSSNFATDATEGAVSHTDDVQGLLKETGESVETVSETTIPPIEEAIPRLDEVTVEFRYKQKFDEKEFSRQLSGQEEGMNNLTVQEYFDNRERYLREGKSKEGAKAQRFAREKAFENKVDDLIDEGMPPAEARAEAKEWLKEQAALHDPDQIAGGDPTKVTSVGDRRVNSSLGSQWRSRVDDMDAQIREFAKDLTPEELQNTYLNIKLTY